MIGQLGVRTSSVKSMFETLWEGQLQLANLSKNHSEPENKIAEQILLTSLQESISWSGMVVGPDYAFNNRQWSLVKRKQYVALIIFIVEDADSPSGTGLEPVTKQATVRYLYHSATAAVTRLITKVKEVPQCNNLDYELESLEEKTKELSKVDEEIHNLLPNDGYDQDVFECEKYEDNAKLTIFLAKKKIQERSEQVKPTFSDHSPTFGTFDEFLRGAIREKMDAQT
ncbi:hypothetical protein TNCV_371661 [Trichonephila clavipes]|nr:hypothetical protein TNCV_371661 [Trichonephila clavipes]